MRHNLWVIFPLYPKFFCVLHWFCFPFLYFWMHLKRGKDVQFVEGVKKQAAQALFGRP